MKKVVVKAALAVLPKSMQYKALCKAINYLMPFSNSPFKKGSVFKLNVVDLKKNWLVECGEQGYKKSSFPIEDVEFRTSFETLIVCNRKSRIEESLDNGNILILGEQNLVDEATKLLLTISQEKLDSLMDKFLVFVKAKKRDSDNAKLSIKFEDIKTPSDINDLFGLAVSLEHSNLEKACELMEIAHKARPNGPVIKQKLDSYRALLEKV